MAGFFFCIEKDWPVPNNQLGLVFIVRCNIFNFTIQNITESVDGVHTDTFIILQTMYQGLTEMIFFVKSVFCDTSFLHGKPQFIIFNQRLSPTFFLSFPHYRVKIESNKGSVFGTYIKEEMD